MNSLDQENSPTPANCLPCIFFWWAIYCSIYKFYVSKFHSATGIRQIKVFLTFRNLIWKSYRYWQFKEIYYVQWSRCKINFIIFTSCSIYQSQFFICQINFIIFINYIIQQSHQCRCQINFIIFTNYMYIL